MTITVLERKGDSVISLKDAKAFLRITHDLEDELIRSSIQAATEWVEDQTGKMLQEKKVSFVIPLNRKIRERAGLFLRVWHSSGRSLFFFPIQPLIELTKVSLISMEGELQEIPPQRIHLNMSKDPAFLMLDEFVGWGFRFECWVGYQDNSLVPGLLKQAVLQAMACFYEDRNDTSTLYAKTAGLLTPFRHVGM
ncbi:MAG: head-tail connector protein [Alphaproteobacteria bacterium]